MGAVNGPGEGPVLAVGACLAPERECLWSTAWRSGWVFSADLELTDMMNNVP